LAVLAVAAACVATGASAHQTSNPPLLIGSNYAHFSLPGCDMTDHGVVHDGANNMPLVSAQLQAMRVAGIQTLRTIVWNMHDATGQRWGIVDSAGGKMSTQYEANFIAYLKLVRAYGFTQLSIAFGPEWVNDPISPDDPWDPTMFDENWHFIQYVRRLAKEYGPDTVHFDLINEGAPSNHWTTKSRVESYDAQMWTNYVEAYGNSDATISVILDSIDMSTLSNLVDTLRATGEPMPQWYEVHDYTGTPLQDLQNADSLLTSKSIDAPLVLGETFYDDAQVATAISSYMRTSSRPLLEAMAWPLARNYSCPSPPFRAHQLYTALTGSDPTPPDLVATVTRPRVAITVNGAPLLGLEAGTYHLSVRNLDPTVVFRLVGPGTNISVSRRPTTHGTTELTLSLQPGTYLYSRNNGTAYSFTVF
jgi:hypothetical protein